MQDQTTSDLQQLLELFGDDPVQAKRRLLERSLERLSRLANKILTESFPRVHQKHELDSVVSEVWIRLQKAMESVQPDSVQGYFRLAAIKIRQVLLDMSYDDNQRQRFRPLDGLSDQMDELGGDKSIEAECTTYNPQRLAAWTQFHQQVASLPDDERHAFELHYYLDLTQADIAKLLDLPARKVSRLWVGAVMRLRESSDWLHTILE